MRFHLTCAGSRPRTHELFMISHYGVLSKINSSRICLKDKYLGHKSKDKGKSYTSTHSVSLPHSCEGRRLHQLGLCSVAVTELQLTAA